MQINGKEKAFNRYLTDRIWHARAVLDGMGKQADEFLHKLQVKETVFRELGWMGEIQEYSKTHGRPQASPKTYIEELDEIKEQVKLKTQGLLDIDRGIAPFRSKVQEIRMKGLSLGYKESEILAMLDNAFKHFFTDTNGMGRPLHKDEVEEIMREGMSDGE